MTRAQDPPPAPSDPMAADASRQGYARAGDRTWFVFDARRYEVAPARVVVTGAFRGWSQDMADPAWALTRDPGDRARWLLELRDPDRTAVPAGATFKFRVDDGRWMEPPSDAPNRDGGNLVFLPGIVPPRLRAELRGRAAVWARLEGDAPDGRPLAPPLDLAAWRLEDARGAPVPLAAVLAARQHEVLLVPADPDAFDRRRVHRLSCTPDGGPTLRARCRFDGWFRELYSAKPLGAQVAADGTRTTFRLFAPRADRVRLFLYDGRNDAPADAREVVEMSQDADAVFEAELPGDLHGDWYDFTVHGPDDPGEEFFGTHPVHVSDPYARVSDDGFGKCRVWRKTAPAAPLPAGRPRLEDVIAYEVHVQDFTDLLPVEAPLRGTFPAMTTPGLTNRRGEPVGFDHLVALGVNVVHLMPVQEFLHYPDEEWRAAFERDPFMIENGTNLENYQWGYRTTHAFAIESRYRARGAEPGAEREQLRDLVQAFHDRGIAVVVDLVPNHTGEDMDGRHHLLNFNAIDRAYYYRLDEEGRHIGPFGNEVKTEDRPMVQRWLIDQCRALLDEIGIDGFRIDLAGQIDRQTLTRLRAALGDDVIVYGEPWIAPSDPDVAADPSWSWYKADAPITYFQDDARNAFQGSPSTPHDKRTDRGYAGGNVAARDAARRALTNGFPEEVDPNRGVNYLDIHDDWALADRFARQDFDGRGGVDDGPYRIAAGLLFTSLGPLVLHGGSELMRSKGAAELKETVKHTAGGPLAFHGKRDTYNHRVANRFVWDDVGRRPDARNPSDHAAMLAWWKGLIELRRSEAGAVFRVGAQPPDDHYRWILPDDPARLGYVVGGRVLVLVNVGDRAGSFDDVRLPDGRWRLVASDAEIDVAGGLTGPDATLRGGRAYDLQVPPEAMRIWVREP